jgi:hypothetical protein
MEDEEDQQSQEREVMCSVVFYPGKRTNCKSEGTGLMRHSAIFLDSSIFLQFWAICKKIHSDSQSPQLYQRNLI